MYSDFRNNIEKFVKLTDEEWQMVLPHLEIRDIKKHDCFAEEGKVASEFGMVLDGMLRHYYTKDGEEKTTFFYFENDFVGSYFSCITQNPSLITIEALSDCKLIVLPYKKMAELFELSATWQKFGRILVEFIAICLEERMVGLLMHSPEERYLELIKGDNKHILERVPQHYVANYLGITPVSMSRIRNRVFKK